MRAIFVAVLVVAATATPITGLSQPCFPYANTSGFTGLISSPTDAECVAAQGNTVMVVAATSLTVFDVTDPDAPHVIGQLARSGGATACQLVGDRLLVALVDGGLQVVDVSDPAQPVAGALIATAAPLEDLALGGSLLLGITFSSGLLVYDVAAPDTPTLVGSATQGLMFAHGVAAYGADHCLVATEEVLCDVSLADPVQPVVVAEYHPASNPANWPMYFGVRVVGDRAVLAVMESLPVQKQDDRVDGSDPWVLLLVDLSVPDPTDSVLGVWRGTSVGVDAVTDDLVLAHDMSMSLAFALPEAPLAWPESWQPQLALAAGSTIVAGAITPAAIAVAAHAPVLRTLPAGPPEVVPALATYASGQSVRLWGDGWAESFTPHGMYADTGYMEYVWDLRDPVQPAVVDSAFCNDGLAYPNITHIKAVDGALVLRETYMFGSSSWSLADHAHTPATHASIAPVRWDAVFSGDLLLAIGSEVETYPSVEGVEVFDVSDPAAPVTRGFLPLDHVSTSYGFCALPGRRLAIGALAPTQLHIVDASDPDAPFVVGSLPLGSILSDQQVVGDRLIGVEGAGTLRVIDPQTVQVVGTLSGLGAVIDMAVQGDLAWLLRSGDELLAVDLQDPTAPALVGLPCSVPIEARRVMLGDGVAYVACGALGVKAVDISDPARPLLRGGGGLAANDVRWRGGVIVVTGAVLPHDCSELTAAPEPQPVVPPQASLTACPNPFNPVTHLRLSVPAAGPAEVAIFDVQGRRVRALFAGVWSAGAQDLVWDGRADDGRQVPSGLYLARLRAAGTTTTARLVLTR